MNWKGAKERKEGEKNKLAAKGGGKGGRDLAAGPEIGTEGPRATFPAALRR